MLYSILLAMAGVLGASRPAMAGAARDSTADGVGTALGPLLGWSPFTYDPAADDSTTIATPTTCVAAAWRVDRRAAYPAAVQRTQAVVHPDTIPFAPAAMEVARTCGRRWTAATAAPIELPGLFRLGLIAGDQALTAAAGAHWTQQAGPLDTARAEALLRQAQWIIETRPRAGAPTALLRSILTQLDALGKGAAAQQAHAKMFRAGQAASFGRFGEQFALADTTRQLIRRIASPVTRDRFLDLMLDAILAQQEAVFTGPFDLTSPAFQAAVERGLADARRDKDTVDSKRKIPLGIPATFTDFLYGAGGVRHDSLIVSRHLAPAAKLIAAAWHGRPDTTVAYPRRGVLTVMMPLPVCSAELRAYCDVKHAAWRQLYDAFAPRGVDFILILRTQGSFGLSTTLPVPAEIDSLRAYVQERVRLPGIVAIQETRFQTLSDGRKVAVGDEGVRPGIMTPDGILWPLGDLEEANAVEAVRAFLTNRLAPSISKAGQE